jgi:ATP-binding cassette subfamily C protein LapB
LSNIENEERDLNTLQDRREVDTLLECLLFLAKYYKRETSAGSLKFNLPIHNRSFDLPMFLKASKRIGLTTKNVKRDKVENLTKLALPAVLLLEKDRSCVLLDYNEKTSIAKIILPGVSSGESEMSLEKLNSEFIGEVIIIKPEYNFNNRIDKEILVETPKEWFWGTLARNKGIYNQVILV